MSDPVTKALGDAMSEAARIETTREEDGVRLMALLKASAEAYTSLLALRSGYADLERRFRDAIEAKDDAWRETNALRRLVRSSSGE